MTVLVDQGLEHTFGAGWTASKYDDWPFYRKYFQWSWVNRKSGNKSVDFVAIDPAGDTLWLIELKNYRRYPREKTMPLPDEVAFKVRDTLAGVFAAAKHDAPHKYTADAQRSLQVKGIRVVLHLEQPPKHTKLFPQPYAIADMQQKLKQRVRGVDPSPLVVETGSLHSLPWSIRSIP